MADPIKFSGNYEDKSTDTGFQYEFKCAKCDSGYRSKFQSFTAGTVTNVLNSANSLLGGIFGGAAQLSNDVRSATWQKAHDDAFIKATEELSNNFTQCPRCNDWVCNEKCWNKNKGLCKKCSPDLGVEMAAAQSSKSVEEVWAHAAMAEEDKKLGTEYWREGIRATCPNCNAPIAQNSKFCPDCGADVKPKAICPACQAKYKPGSKFCPDCGVKLTP
jgi:hypothetical protein